MTKYTTLTYSEKFLFRQDAIEEARRLRKAFSGQHVKLTIWGDIHEDYVLVDGIPQWFVQPVFFVEVRVHKESKQIPF